jgi:hypothetical protein
MYEEIIDRQIDHTVRMSFCCRTYCNQILLFIHPSLDRSHIFSIDRSSCRQIPHTEDDPILEWAHFRKVFFRRALCRPALLWGLTVDIFLNSRSYCTDHNVDMQILCTVDRFSCRTILLWTQTMLWTDSSEDTLLYTDPTVDKSYCRQILL